MLAQLLIGASFAVAAYQDVKFRAVSDIVWIPALAGSGYVIYKLLAGPSFADLELQLVKIALIGGIALAFALFGAVGEADSIALVFIAADPYRYSPILPLAMGAVLALAHIVYLIIGGNAWGLRTVPIEQFLKEQKWIPEAVISDGVRTEVSSDVNDARDEVEASKKPGAMVEVKYGVPTVAYLGLGYIAFLAYLVLLNQAAFLALP